MAITELMGSRNQVWTLQGGTGRRVFKGDWDTWQQQAPRLAATFPGAPALRLKETTVEPITQNRGSTGYDECRITCQYATFEFIDDQPVESGSISGEALEVGLGRRWASTGRSVQQAVSVIFPLMDWAVRMTMRSVPKAAILDRVGKVNWAPFLGFPRETLLFHGADWDSRFDYERQTYIYSVNFHFTYRPMGWNVQWRAPVQARQDGILLYQDDGEPVFVSGSAGEGGWDRMVPPIYEMREFNALFGWPPLMIGFKTDTDAQATTT